ncbi:MAG TPA: family 1 glycosylhydrolase [Burkholderiaceae bacterium]|nr:family 1 glycosylhydrolase [Burkholderiaceae bacterium]
MQGYFAWSFVDNHEWALGFTKRFGIVHVDHAAQRRTVKYAGAWFGLAAREKGFPLADANAVL